MVKGSAGLYYGRTPMIYFPLRGAGVSNTTLFAPASRFGVTFPEVLPSAIAPGSDLAALIGPPAISYVDPEFGNPRVLQLTASVTRRVAGMSLEAGYMRSESRNLRIGGFRSTTWDRNLAPPTRFDEFGRGVDILAAGRPDTTIAQANALASFGRGRYQALMVSLSKPMANRWQFYGNYTLAKSTGNGSTERDTEALFGPSDPFNPGADEGINELDERHQIKSYLVLALPRDITLASTWSAGSGLAFPVYSATDLNGDGVTNDGRQVHGDGQSGASDHRAARIEVEAASALVDASSGRTDEALRRARADLRLAFGQLVSAQVRERELTASRDRLRALADILAKREAAGDAAGFDRLRAEREVVDVDTDRAAAATDRARAQAILAGFFVEPVDRLTIVAVDASGIAPPLPPVDALVERAVSTRGELRALLKEGDAARLSQRAADRRLVPEPEVVAGTKSSTAGGGDTGSVFTVHASLPLFDRNVPERALAEARAKQSEARAEAFRVTLRADIAALRVAVMERRDTADRYRTAAVSGIGEIERIAQVSYDAGERGILELLDAYRTGATARVRQAVLDAAVRQAEIELEFVSGWEIPR